MRTTTRRSCEDPVVSVLQDLRAKRHAYAEHDGECFLDTLQNVQLVTNAERNYRIMYYGSRASSNLRDRHMFDTLQSLLAFHGPNSKGIVWAHNSHVGDSAATEMGIRGEYNIGHLCRAEQGVRAYSIGFGTHSGTVAAASDWGGPMLTKTVTPALPHSCERLCHETGVNQFLLALRDKSANSAFSGLLSPRLGRAIGVVSRPETELQSH